MSLKIHNHDGFSHDVTPSSKLNEPMHGSNHQKECTQIILQYLKSSMSA